jgi:hypothetical protein
VAITRTPETICAQALGRLGDYNRPEILAEAYEGLDRPLIIATVDAELGKRRPQNVAAIDAAVKGRQACRLHVGLGHAAEGGAGAPRRTPGLRREEVAQRANISPTWYTLIE